ncbi:AraC-type DNA-binding protein [Paenibacillus sp. 1_12]|uniref:helix-turn-helix domain-containing protein n=1 Tax=Paenibacillus sp. 1_12 TaxID=1566278 RepID=UPI0008ED79E8|nr:cache domain-containing protein [Paenibacillus sp. 1_12]SFM30116.1 AraC-type DNA-binding protein [Paenibacillus sp. 1_12]
MLPYVRNLLTNKRHNNRSVFISMLISNIVILLLPLVIGFFLYTKVEQIMMANASRSNLAMLEQLRLTMDNHFKEVNQLAQQIVFNPKIDQLLSNDSTEDRYSEIEFIRYLKTYQKIDSGFIKDYYVYFQGSNTILSPSIRTDSQTFYDRYYKYENLSYEQWKKELLESYHNMHYLPTARILRDGGMGMMNNQDRMPINVITYVHSLPVREVSDIRGSLIILLDEQQIKDRLKQIEAANQSAIYIINDKQNVILSTTDEYELSSALFDKLTNPTGLFDYSLNGKDMMVSYTTTDEAGWKYISVMLKDHYMKPVYSIKMTAFGLFILCLVVGVGFAYLAAYRNYSPVKHMVTAIMQGKRTVTRPSGDEYEFIRESIEGSIIEEKQLRDTLSQQASVVRANFLSRLIRGQVDLSQIQSTESLGFLNLTPFVYSSYAVMVIQVDDASHFTHNQSEKQWALIRFIISNIGMDMVNEGHIGYDVDLDRDRLAFLINLDDDGQGTAADELKFIAHSLKQVVETRFKLILTVAISKVHESLEEIGEGYEEALAALDYKMIMGQSVIICYDDIKDTELHYHYPIETEAQLMNLVKSGDFENVEKLLDNIYELNFSSDKLTPELGTCIFFNMVSTLLKIMNASNIGYGGMEEEGIFDPIKQIQSSGTAQEMHEKTKRFYKQLTRLLQSERSGHSDLLLADIKRFIDGRCTDPNLGLAMISSHCGKTPQYISTFFKKASGHNITDYISRIRIDQAKILMENKALTNLQIAQMVGYMNDLAFIRVFKKIEGVTPGKYRESLSDDTVYEAETT